jgi:hypothetical protein
MKVEVTIQKTNLNELVISTPPVIASGAKQSRTMRNFRDCFVAPLLAMTGERG